MAVSDELEKKIKSYQPTQVAKDAAAQTRFLLVAGPAGSGKNSVIKELLKSDDYVYIVSHTTRQPRPNEEHGRNYYFVDEATMATMVDEKQLVEAETIYGEYVSGTSISAVREVKDSGKIGVTDIDVAGAETYMKLNPNTRAVFILPPSYDEWVRRLAQRGSGESQDEIKRRLENAQIWLEQALASGYWHFVINTDLKKAVDDIKAFAGSPKAELPEGDTRVEHAWHVLGELKKQLNS